MFAYKIGKCPFQAKKKKKKKKAFCPISQTNYGNVPILKLDFLKIELYKKIKIKIMEPYSGVLSSL